MHPPSNMQSFEKGFVGAKADISFSALFNQIICMGEMALRIFGMAVPIIMHEPKPIQE